MDAIENLTGTEKKVAERLRGWGYSIEHPLVVELVEREAVTETDDESGEEVVVTPATREPAEVPDRSRVRIQGFGLDATLPAEGHARSWEVYGDRDEHVLRALSSDNHDALTKDELDALAAERDIEGRSKMSKDELADAIRSTPA